jgi:hypothetical protein
MFSPQLSPFLFALASIPTYVYRVSLEGSNDQVVGKIILRPRGVAGIGLVPKSALCLFPSAAAQQAATLNARRRKWKFLYWQGALTSKYPVPSGPRDTKALTFRHYLFN